MKKVMVMLALTLAPRLLAAEALDVKALAGEDWYGLYFNGAKAGYALSKLEVTGDGSVRLSLDATFRIAQMGMDQELDMSERRTYGPDGALQAFSTETGTPGAALSISGKVVDGQLELTEAMAGKSATRTAPAPKESLEDTLRRIALVQQDAEIGRSAGYTRYEPMFKMDVEGTTTITAVEKKLLNGAATKVYTVKTVEDLPGGPMESVARIDENGKVLEDTVQGMMTMRLEPEAVAKDIQFTNDVIVSNAVDLAEPISSPREVERLKVKLRGPLTGRHALESPRQKAALTEDGALFDLTRAKTPPGAKRPVDEEAVAPWLEPSQFVQSDAPEIQEQAAAIAGDEADAFTAAEEIAAWVHANMTTTYSASLSNALDVLASKQGDCTEHSVLFVALVRAAGIPAREVAGLVYTDNPAPGFYFHQWAEVWAGEWVEMDPTFGQPLADATHIRLSEGDLLRQMHLLPIIGRLEAEAEVAEAD